MNAKSRRNAERFGNSRADSRPSKETAPRLAATSSARSSFRSTRLHVDAIATDKLASAVKVQFIKLRHGKFDWDDPLEFSPEVLAKLLAEALCSGDVVLTATIAATLHARGADQRAIAEHAMRAFLLGSCHDQAQRIAELQAKVNELQEAA